MIQNTALKPIPSNTIDTGSPSWIYTAFDVSALIKDMFIFNGSGGDATVTIWAVQSSETPDASNKIYEDIISTKRTVDFPFVVCLDQGGSLVAQSSAADVGLHGTITEFQEVS